MIHVQEIFKTRERGDRKNRKRIQGHEIGSI